MRTIFYKLNPNDPDISSIKKAAKIIVNGGLVAFPTETVYGLGANALDEKAVAKIFQAKERPADDPLIVHITDKKTLNQIALEIPEIAQKLITKFWPGPLSLVFKKKLSIPDNVTAGLSTVAVRMPSNTIALQLIKLAGVPIAAPSANLFGKPSPTLAQHVKTDLDGKIDLLIDGGPTNIGVESTVLDLTTTPPTLLRPGGVTKEMIEDTIGKINIDPLSINKNRKSRTKSPGMSYKHYAPNAKVILIEGNRLETRNQAKLLVNKYRLLGMKIGILEEINDVDDFARKLFKSFRKFDDDYCDIIIVCGLKEEGLGSAVMNRLRRAASEIIKV